MVMFKRQWGSEMHKMNNRSASSNNLPDASQRRKVLSMAILWDDEDIAYLSGLSIEQVRFIIGSKPVEQWWGRCKRSGSTVVSRGWRGVYRSVCLRGWTDWEWGKGTVIGEQVQP